MMFDHAEKCQDWFKDTPTEPLKSWKVFFRILNALDIRLYLFYIFVHKTKQDTDLCVYETCGNKINILHSQAATSQKNLSGA